MSAWYSALPAIIQSPAPVTVITAPEYPSLFIVWLVAELKKNNRTLMTLDVNTENIDEVQCQLSSSFLGNICTFWLRGVQELEKSSHKRFINFINGYKGPHTIFFFFNEYALSSSIATFTLPERITKDEFFQLTGLYGISVPERSSGRQLIQQLFQTYQTISIEQAMLILNYLPLVGRSVIEFMHEWMPRLMTGDQSLFGLSQAFFAKNLPQTLLLWQQMRDQYSDQFWTAYWSEQLFRAYFVAKALQTRDNTLDVRRLSARLPFSFIKRDWKRWQLYELASAHSYITRLELDLKNGAASWQLDTFYLEIITL